jgi:hypothetical protein
MRSWFSRAAFVALVLFALPAFAQERIDQLGAGTAVSGTDAVPNCQGCGASTAAVKTTLAQILTYIQNNLSALTNLTIGPGLTTIVGTQNPGTDAITSTGTIYPQNWPVNITGNCTINSNCNGAVTNETGEQDICTSNSTVTYPNPSSATKGNSYLIGSDGTHHCSLATVGGTANFYGDLGSGTGATTYALLAGVDFQLIDTGTAYKVIAAGLSGAAALPNGSTATTQTTGDNSTKVATDAFVIANAGSGGGAFTLVSTITCTSGPTCPGSSTANCGSSVQCMAWTGLTGNEYILRCSAIKGAGSNSIGIQAGEGGTPTWETTNYNVAGSVNYVTLASVAAYQGAQSAFVAVAAPTSGTILQSFDISLHGLATTGANHIATGSITGIDSANFAVFTLASEYTGDTNAITALRVIDTNGGSLQVGSTCSLYAVSS